MDDPNITMEEYIKLEEEKSQKHAIALKDGVSSEKTLSCEPTVSSLNNKIDFRISFDDSDDEDYTVIFDKNSFSYKIISTNDLKTDSENDDEKVNMPSHPSPEPTVKEKNVLYFNDLFPFDIIHPNDLKSEKDSDDNEVDIIQSSGDMALPPCDQRHQYLRYEGLQYTYADIVDFKARLARIYKREVHRVQVFDFGGLPDLMADGLSARMLMEHRDAQGVSLFTSRAWKRLFDIRGPL
ncbi:hypothetical protein Tco_1452927, partial [Tanacetum coccineum]